MGINFDSPISIGDTSFHVTEGVSDVNLNLEGYMAFKGTDGLLTVTEDDDNFVYLYAKGNDLYVKYWNENFPDNQNPVIKNISANTITWNRHDDGMNLFYQDGNVGIFNPFTINEYLNPVDKLHLADGNFILQPALLPIVDGQRSNWNEPVPRIKFKSASTENEELNIGITNIVDPNIS